MSAPVTDTPTDQPTAPAPKRARSFLSKAKKTKDDQTAIDARAITAIDAIVIESASTDSLSNSLNSNEVVRQSLVSPTPSSGARGQIIRRARERLNANADRLVRDQLAIIDRGLQLSHVDPKYLDVARRAVEKLMDAVADDGERLITKAESTAQPMPTFQIGIALGGMPTQKLLEK